MKVREYDFKDELQVIQLIAEFRVEMAQLKAHDVKLDLVSAKEELHEYLRKRFPIFVAADAGTIAGHLICRVDEDVVWTESLYVSPTFRHKGIASELHTKAESLSKSLGGDTVYYGFIRTTMQLSHSSGNKGTPC
jgi:GNAT superfamily N-acetyltransferase